MNYFKEIKKLQERVDKLEEIRNPEPEQEEVKREKITLKEFFDSEEQLAIHCDTEEKAKRLLKEFHKMGKRLASGLGYDEVSSWYCYQNKTIYDNKGFYYSIEFEFTNKYKVYEFKDIIFEEPREEKFTENEKVILRSLPEKFKYITRDTYGELGVYAEEPYKRCDIWLSADDWGNLKIFEHIFKSIQWTDTEPCEFRKYL